ncbi:hypothetical protein IT413_02760 [Candidatus Peregrinibacteria bacterium]|nr:hypothetical protein [Candidatus Peregrinibacteria bacterium]
MDTPRGPEHGAHENVHRTINGLRATTCLVLAVNTDANREIIARASKASSAVNERKHFLHHEVELLNQIDGLVAKDQKIAYFNTLIKRLVSNGCCTLASILIEEIDKRAIKVRQDLEPKGANNPPIVIQRRRDSLLDQVNKVLTPLFGNDKRSPSYPDLADSDNRISSIPETPKSQPGTTSPPSVKAPDKDKTPTKK